VPPASGELAEAMIPDTVNGLPLHALAVHGAVVMVPLAAVLGLVFAVPRLREWARWPLALVAVGAAVATWVAVESGERLEAALENNGALGGPVHELVEEHAELAGQLEWMVIGYAVLAVAAALVVERSTGSTRRRVGGGEPAAANRSAARGSSALALVFSVLLVLGAVAVGVQTYRVGDAGAKAVWNPTGDIKYSSG